MAGAALLSITVVPALMVWLVRGKILPVGGIKEKVLAAKRAGIERVVLPDRNRRDVEEISSDLLDGLELCFVGTIEEALQHTLCEAPSN